MSISELWVLRGSVRESNRINTSPLIMPPFHCPYWQVILIGGEIRDPGIDNSAAILHAIMKGWSREEGLGRVGNPGGKTLQELPLLRLR